MEYLFEYERVLREYKKQEVEYWNIKIYESRVKWLKICIVQLDGEVIFGDFMIDDMTVEEIKSKFKEKGIIIRVRFLKKL